MKVFRIPMCVTMLMLAALFGLSALTGCSDENAVAPETTADDEFAAAAEKGITVDFQTGRQAPAGLVAVPVAGSDLVCWPFTGSSFNGTGVDPINIVFTGNAEPMQIRAALLALDGDRSVLGLPPVYPFDQQWHDAVGGGVQTSYDEEGGWLGSVIQLTLGDYEPVRFHLRLFRTGARTAAGDPITLGAAHFEVLIPGTSEHQVLSWEVAEQIVVGDMMRSGLLNPAEHIGQTGEINPAPSWRTIDPSIYNGLPAELIQLISGPSQPQSGPVPITTDGHATTVHLAGARPVQPMTETRTATVTFGQYVPRPFCSTGPYDWLHITGGVEFFTTVTVDRSGRYSYRGGYEGTIYATPIDISTGQPVGAEFSADVRGQQSGQLARRTWRVQAYDRKMSREEDGNQINVVSLWVGEHGLNVYRAFDRCIDQ